MKQEIIVVPCDLGTSKHWFLVVVSTKEKQVLTLNGIATSLTKPSTVEACEKIWSLLGRSDDFNPEPGSEGTFVCSNHFPDGPRTRHNPSADYPLVFLTSSNFLN